jgi:NAD(P)-dependent dehydrogenase (short-subunit alcohol dehydrogenase family)
MSKIWLITGSSRGLGRALSEAVLEAGDRLVATARNVASLADLAERHGDRVRLETLDVTDGPAAEQAVKAAVDAFGRLDIVVNNAGYGNIAPIEDVTEVDFRAQMDVNFYGVFHVTRAAIPVMRAQKSGHVIQISSIGGRIGTAGLSAYQSAKFAVEGFSEVLNGEVSPLGIKVTIVEPGGFRTDWAGSSMTISDISEAYQPSIGRLVSHLETNCGRETGDPAKGANAILEIAGIDKPPLRLLLGSDAAWIAEAAGRRQQAEDLAWRELTLSTDFDEEATRKALAWKS